jgi:hypothetical protein
MSPFLRQESPPTLSSLLLFKRALSTLCFPSQCLLPKTRSLPHHHHVCPEYSMSSKSTNDEVEFSCTQITELGHRADRLVNLLITWFCIWRLKLSFMVTFMLSPLVSPWLRSTGPVEPFLVFCHYFLNCN